MNNIDKLAASNIYNKPVEVAHTELERTSDESMFRSVCPVCEEGTLLVRRDHETFKLIESDNCVLCGQQFVYLDIDDLRKKAGE